jgi:hypothetical protein
MRSANNSGVGTFSRPLFAGGILNTITESAFTPGRMGSAVKGAIAFEIAFEHVSFRYRPASLIVPHDTRRSDTGWTGVRVAPLQAPVKSTLTNGLRNEGYGVA